MIDSTYVELITAAILTILGGGGGFYGKYIVDNHRADRANGRMDKMDGRMDHADVNSQRYLTEQKFADSREACRKEILTKLEGIDITLRGDGKINGNPGLVPSIQSISNNQRAMAITIDEIRKHQKNGGT